MFLRNETRSDHEATEAAFAPFDVATEKGLAGFLTAHYLAITAVETRLAEMPWLPELPPLPPARDLIAADLERLGRPVPTTFLPPVDASEPVGQAYVMAGSRLGNRLIRKYVAQNGAADIQESITYINAQSLDLHGQTVLNALSELRVVDRASCLAGARATFRTFGAAAKQAARMT